MAGLIFQKAQNSRTIAQRQQPNPLLVRHGVSLGRGTYYTHVPEGSSAESIIEKAAKANGGFVVKLFDPKLNATEILAVKLGDQLLVKGDFTKMLRADLSSLAPADRLSVLRAAKTSQGGLHIFLGEDGIPIYADKQGGLVFPNAEELRIGGKGDVIRIALVDYNFDPGNLRDLDDHYSGSGGIRVSEDARAFISITDKDEISRSHGGGRSEKLMLDDNSVLILKMNSGEIVTMAENGIRPEGFAVPKFVLSHHATTGLVYQNESSSVRLPFDASRATIPYLFVKIFDGRITDQVKIVLRPLELPSLLPPFSSPQCPSPATSETPLVNAVQKIPEHFSENKERSVRICPPLPPQPGAVFQSTPLVTPPTAATAKGEALEVELPLPASKPLSKKQPLLIDLQIVKDSWQKLRISRINEIAPSRSPENESPVRYLPSRSKRRENEEKKAPKKHKGQKHAPAADEKAKPAKKQKKPQAAGLTEKAESKRKKSPGRHERLPESVVKQKSRTARPPSIRSKELKKPAKTTPPSRIQTSRKKNRRFILEVLGLYRDKRKKKPRRGRARAGNSG